MENLGKEESTLKEEAASKREDGGASGETTCEVFGCSPKWMQKLANIKMYIVIYGLLGFGHFTIGTYLTAIVTTIEKRFRLPSRLSGTILSAWDIGSMWSILVLAYLGSSGHKTRWVATGTLCISLSCLINLLPHLIYGPGEDAILLASDVTTLNRSETDNWICKLSEDDSCESYSHENTLPAYIFIVSNMISGIGGCMYYTLGVAYLDDNSNKNRLPFYLAIVFCLRMFGPTLGFMIASVCLNTFIDPSLKPTITNEDPRWLGAWWIGWVPLGIFNFILALCMFPFPRRLPRIAKEDKPKQESAKPRSIKDFKVTMRRLFKNKILIFNSISTTFYLLGVIGYWSFMPKYFETQFHKSASTASLITGSVGLICTAMGIISSGIFISRFKPSPFSLAAWNVFVESVEVVGHISYAFLGCPTENLQGSWDSSGKWNMIEPCNEDCHCSEVKYNPLCSQDGATTFFSPCHAGCTESEIINGTMIFSNCSCSANGLVNEGVCPVDCSYNFIVFLIILCTLRFFGASGRAGNSIIQFRSVNTEDKSVAIGLSELMFSIFGFVPGPMFYGHLMDTTCLVWGYVCGKSGNCWLYDGQSLRYYLNFSASGFLAIAVLADIGVLMSVKGLKIYEEDFKKGDEKSKSKLNEALPFIEY